MTTGHFSLISDYSRTILASGMNFDCYGNATDITSILFISYFCSQGAFLLVVCEGS